MAAYSTGCPALGRIMSKLGDLYRAGIGTRQSTRRAGHRGDDRVGRGYRAEVYGTPADTKLDARHAASRATLRSYRSGRKAQQLGVVGDEDQLGFGAGEFNCADYSIARFQADHIPCVFAE